tara:strand:- start:53 stop:478 length:426 start_codon:yes stop_codon:yes gene_type:complete
MGNSASALKIHFEDMQRAISKTNIIIISTLDRNKQSCLIEGTLRPEEEESKINQIIKSPKQAPGIIIYGENACDDTASKKYLQLIRLGFKDIAIYSGGLFEWLLLQDIYGDELFPTNGTADDMLQYKGVSKITKVAPHYQS